MDVNGSSMDDRGFDSPTTSINHIENYNQVPLDCEKTPTHYRLGSNVAFLTIWNSKIRREQDHKDSSVIFKRMTEYYWVLQDELNSTSMFWKFDKYLTLLVNISDLSQDKIISSIKVMIPKCVTHVRQEVREFKPSTNSSSKNAKLVIFHVSDGLTKVGPIWTSASSAEEFLKDVVVNGYYSVG